jgi:hypothetical protein
METARAREATGGGMVPSTVMRSLWGTLRDEATPRGAHNVTTTTRVPSRQISPQPRSFYTALFGWNLIFSCVVEEKWGPSKRTLAVAETLSVRGRRDTLSTRDTRTHLIVGFIFVLTVALFVIALPCHLRHQPHGTITLIPFRRRRWVAVRHNILAVHRMRRIGP